MSPSFLRLTDGVLIPLPARRGMPASVHVIDGDSVLAINAALGAGRPLLLRGEPGTGKSQLARAAAEGLGRAFVHFAVDGRTEAHDLLWSIDAVARLAEAQVMGALHGISEQEVRRRIDVLEFLRPGVLWWAFAWASAAEQASRARVRIPETPQGWSPERGVVVLIDEIDKADASVPNGLLDAFGHGCFDVPGRDPVSVETTTTAPLVVITTNEERSLPDAFLRRCLVHHLRLPDDPRQLADTLVARGKAHFPQSSSQVLLAAAEQLIQDREAYRREGLAVPGLAEYIDLVRAVTRQEEAETQQLALLAKIARFAFRKHPSESEA